MQMKNGRLIAIILSLLMLWSSILAVFAETGTPQANLKAEVSNDALEVVEPTEIVSLREESTKHFRLPDGTYQAVVYGDPIHRKDIKGEWQDIDNRLMVNNNKTFATSDERLSFTPSVASGETIMTLTENGYSISLGIDSNQTSSKSLAVVENHPSRESTVKAPDGTLNIDDLAKIDNKTSVIYRNVFENADLEYIIAANNIKENIIVKGVCDHYRYVFVLEMVGLTAVLEDDGSITLRDAISGESEYIMPAPFMYDANGKYSNDVRYELSKVSEEKYELSLTAKESWINDEDRAFPVVIDPTITIQYFSFDTYVSSYTPSGCYGHEDAMWVTRYSTSFIKIHHPPLPSGTIINNGYLHAAHYFEGSSGYLYAGAYQVLYPWEQYDLTYNLAAQNPNLGISTTRLSMLHLTSSPAITKSTPEYVVFNITNAVLSWYSGEPNNGIAIRRETGTYDGDAFGVVFETLEAEAGRGPYLSINYNYNVPDGIYALKNAGNFDRWMDIQYDSIYPGYHMQQYAFGHSPIYNTGVHGLYLVKRVPGTDRYIIRAMINNSLTFGAVGTDVKTKTISLIDSEVPATDTFYIEHNIYGCTIRPHGSETYVSAQNTQNSGSSGAPLSYLKMRTLSDAGDRARWVFESYTELQPGLTVTVIDGYTKQRVPNARIQFIGTAISEGPDKDKRRHYFANNVGSRYINNLTHGHTYGINIYKDGYLISFFSEKITSNNTTPQAVTVSIYPLTHYADLRAALTHPWPKEINNDKQPSVMNNQLYGWRRLNYQLDFHQGFDIGPTQSDRTLEAVADGIVVKSGVFPSCGVTVQIEFFVNGQEYYATYMHLQTNTNIAKGSEVRKGTKIGTAGTTGDSTGVHLHFSIATTSTLESSPKEVFLDAATLVGIPHYFTPNDSVGY